MEKNSQSPKEMEWYEKLKKWKSSGLSGQRWSQEVGISYCQFLYWKLKLIGRDDQQEPSLSKEDFQELSDHDAISSGIVLECSGIAIRLSKNFDPLTLKKCINVLRVKSC